MTINLKELMAKKQKEIRDKLMKKGMDFKKANELAYKEVGKIYRDFINYLKGGG